MSFLQHFENLEDPRTHIHNVLTHNVFYRFYSDDEGVYINFHLSIYLTEYT